MMRILCANGPASVAPATPSRQPASPARRRARYGPALSWRHYEPEAAEIEQVPRTADQGGTGWPGTGAVSTEATSIWDRQTRTLLSGGAGDGSVIGRYTTTESSRRCRSAGARAHRRRPSWSWPPSQPLDRKSTRLNSSHANISYAV